MRTRMHTRRTSAITVTVSLAVAGAAAAGAGAGAAASASAAVGPAAPAYRLVPVAPTARPDGTREDGSAQAAGISESGVVAGTSWGRTRTLVFTGDGRRSRWLTTGAQRTEDALHATAMSPNGRVVASFLPPVGRLTVWDDTGRARSLDVRSAGFLRGAAVNRSGQVAATLSSTKTCSSVRILDAGGRARAAAPPVASNCEIGGLSDGGLAVGTLTAPALPTPDRFPRAFALAGGRLVAFHGTGAMPSTADAISPDGRHIIGRRGASEVATGAFTGTVVRLSTTRSPRAVPGARDLVPEDVNNRGQIVGVADGRAKIWTDGRLTDLTTAVRGLPRGSFVSAAAGINERGEIAVTVTDATDPNAGRNRAVKLVPAGR